MIGSKLGIHSIRFSKDFFASQDLTNKWMEEHGFDKSQYVELDRFFAYEQLAKNRFIESSLQDFKLDSGVCAMVGILLSEQGTNFDNVHDGGEITISNEPTESELDVLRQAFIDQTNLFKEYLEEIISLTEPARKVQDSAIGKFDLIVAETATEISKVRSKLFREVKKRQQVSTKNEGESCDFELYAPIFKSDDEEDERIFFALVLEPFSKDAEIGDGEGDIYTAKDIEFAAHYWMENFGSIGLMHETLIDDKVSVLETYLAPVSFTVKRYNGKEKKVKKGTWLMKLRINDDDLWQQVKDGELTGLSMGGIAAYEELDNDEGGLI